MHVVPKNTVNGRQYSNMLIKTFLCSWEENIKCNPVVTIFNLFTEVNLIIYSHLQSGLFLWVQHVQKFPVLWSEVPGMACAEMNNLDFFISL